MFCPQIRMRFSLVVVLATLLCPSARAAYHDWFEGTMDLDNGATRDFYNRGAALPWDNYLGDWHDADGVAQGDHAHDTITLVDDDTPKWVEWDITALVAAWADGSVEEKGLMLRGIDAGGSHRFRSREYSDPAERPQLVIETDSDTHTLTPIADTYLEPSTYQCFGDDPELRMGGSNNLLMRFDFDPLGANPTIVSATLRLYTTAQYGTTQMAGVFSCNQGHDNSDPAVPGLAAAYENDANITDHTDVIFATGFESATWEEEWTSIGYPEYGLQLTEDPDLLFEPFLGNAVRSQVPADGLGGMTLSWDFMDETGSEPEEIYWRYYLRLADNWRPTVSGGKLPGISGTYGVAGWGGRPSHGDDGWSARGSFSPIMDESNPMWPKANRIGFYCYHADMTGTYGDIWDWVEGYGGYLENNRWYCIEQQCVMNTPGANDGVLRAWVDGKLAFEKTDISFRTVPELKIERIWMNVYHGGTEPTPFPIALYFDNVVIARSYIGPANAPAVARSETPRRSDAPHGIGFQLADRSVLVRYAVPSSGPVTLTISTLSGELVRTLVGREARAGSDRATWDLTDRAGRPVTAGTYVVVLSTRERTLSRPLPLVR